MKRENGTYLLLHDEDEYLYDEELPVRIEIRIRCPYAKLSVTV